MVTEQASVRSSRAEPEPHRSATGLRGSPDRSAVQGSDHPPGDGAATILAPLIRAVVGTDAPVRFEFWDGTRHRPGGRGRDR